MRHQNAANSRWRYTQRYPSSYWRRGATWGGVAGWVGGGWTEPVYYDYGNTLSYQDGNVYQDGELIAVFRGRSYATRQSFFESDTENIEN